MRDPGKESHNLQYLDANNLYGRVMSQNFPTGGFKWIANPEKLKDIEMAKKVGKGYLLEVDLSYSQNLHNMHTGLLLMCEKRKINGVLKLVPNLYDKKKYVIHITALDQALKHGLVLDNVH